MTTHEEANHVAKAIGRGLPHLEEDSDRLVLIQWLATCDPNGTYTDEDMAAEGWEPMSTEDAWGCIQELLEG